MDNQPGKGGLRNRRGFIRTDLIIAKRKKPERSVRNSRAFPAAFVRFVDKADKRYEGERNETTMPSRFKMLERRRIIQVRIHPAVL